MPRYGGMQMKTTNLLLESGICEITIIWDSSITWLGYRRVKENEQNKIKLKYSRWERKTHVKEVEIWAVWSSATAHSKRILSEWNWMSFMPWHTMWHLLDSTLLCLSGPSDYLWALILSLTSCLRQWGTSAQFATENCARPRVWGRFSDLSHIQYVSQLYACLCIS